VQSAVDESANKFVQEVLQSATKCDIGETYAQIKYSMSSCW